MDKKSKKTWGIGGSISLDDLKQHFDKKREEAAESLDVSVSTLKRICRENGISRWPSKKIKRERLLLSNLSSNETVLVAGGGQKSISTTPTAFASTKVSVKSNQQKSWRSNVSLDNEISRNVSEPNQDHLASFHEVDTDKLISMDDLESNCIKSQSTLELKSEPSLQNDARRMKLIFEKFTLPLEDLTNPNHEASMKEASTILAGNLSLFADEQAKQLLELKFDFPTITCSWRDCSQSRIDCQNFLAEFENTKSLLETSTKEEEDLNNRYTQLENNEKEMMAQLEAIQKKKNEITRQRSENFKPTNHLADLAEEQAGRTKEKELQLNIASAKLDKLKSQWISVQSSFK